MNNIQPDQASTVRQMTAKTIDRSGWGLFLIWIGFAFMLNIGWVIHYCWRCSPCVRMASQARGLDTPNVVKIYLLMIVETTHG